MPAHAAVRLANKSRDALIAIPLRPNSLQTFYLPETTIRLRERNSTEVRRSDLPKARGAHHAREQPGRHARDARAGGDRDLRLHRVLLQQGQDPLGAGMPQPQGVRAGEPARGGPPPDGGIGV